MTDEVVLALTCTSAGSAAGVVADVVVTFDTDITSKGSENAIGSPVEALLLLDPGESVPLHFSGPLSSPPNYTTPFSSSYGSIYQAVKQSSRSIRWQGVPIIPAGAPAGFERTILMRNIRVDATQAIPSASEANLAHMHASVTLSGSAQSVVVLPESVVVPTCGSFVTMVDAPLLQPNGSADLEVLMVSRAPCGITGSYWWRRKSAASNLPNNMYGYWTEDLFTPAVSGLTGDPGVATSGTRIWLRFTNVPAGVSLQAPRQIGAQTSSLWLKAVDNPGSDGTGAVSDGDQAVLNVPVVAGTGILVYEVQPSAGLAPWYLTFPVKVIASGNTQSGTGRVEAGLAPFAAAVVPSTTTPHIPRFQASALQQVDAFTVLPTVYTISGTVTKSGSPLNGVSVALSGSMTRTQRTGASGAYSFTVPPGSYTVTPSLSEHAFTPGSLVLNSLQSNATVNFAAGPGCVFTPAFSTVIVHVNGGSGSLPFEASSPVCAWDISASDSWLNITSPASGTGSGAVHFTVAANSGWGRQTNLLISGKAIQVRQEGYNPVTAGFRNDFNKDGCADVVFQDPGTGWAQVWYLSCMPSAPVTVSSAANLTLQNTWRIAAIADMDGDAKTDILWQDPITGAVQVWFMSGISGNQIAQARSIVPSSTWRLVAVADIDRSGPPDLIWQNPTTGESQAWLLKSLNPWIIASASLSGPNGWRIVAAADMDLDGKPDLIWQDQGSGFTQIWYLGGTDGTTVTSAANLVQSNTWRISAIADYNRDARPDLIWQDPVTGASQIWFLHGLKGNEVLGAQTLGGPNGWRISGPK